MTRNLCARFSAFLLVLVCCGACRKTLGPCTGNCQVVEFTGIVLDPGAQKPLGGVAVTVEMPGGQTCTFCNPNYQVASGKTRSDGTFDLKTSVDTTKVGFRFPTVTVHGPGNYIAYAEPVGPGIEPDAYSNIVEAPMLLDSTGVAPFREYDFFQPVLLTVRLHRNSAIVPSEPSLGLNFYMGISSISAWGLDESASNADTALTLHTGANVYTRINAIQWITDSTKANQTDSIRCVPGGNNTIDISY
jgi:hypothetical protein